MTILLDAEKAFGKIQHPFTINIQQRKEGTFFNLIKDIYEKPTEKTEIDE